ncbi:unnamed protein product [Cunninghamella blakesleeana]
MKNMLWFTNRSSSIINKYGKWNELKSINETIQLRWNITHNKSINTTNSNNNRISTTTTTTFDKDKILKQKVVTTNNNTKELSKRQLFKQIQPPLKLYEKLERLGFGALRQTNKFKSINKQKHKKRDLLQKENTLPEPTYTFPILSFMAGAKTSKSFPPNNLEEVAFVGRSNVGKSSLLNSLASTTIVRTSDKPGLTQQINFFNVGRLFTMVDMPGYGFAFVDDEQRKEWRELMEEYITKRKSLKRLYVVIDARHGLKLPDHEFLHMLENNKVKFQIIMTKCDIPVLPDLAKRIIVVKDSLNQYNHAIKEIMVVSSKSGAGINQLRKEMLFLTGHLKPREFYEDKNAK